MVKVEGRAIEARPDEVLVGNIAYPKSIKPPIFPKGIDTQSYVLNTWDDGNYALSGLQMFNGSNFDSMTKEALGEGQFLARFRDVAPFLRDVNRALRSEGVIYHASGSLVEGERLAHLGEFVNNAWIYLNDRFEKGTGFEGLDVTHLVGMEGDKQVTQRQPLQPYHIGWADVLGEMNPQGYFTQKAPVEKFEQGKTIYQHAPVAGRVVGLGADSGRASVYSGRGPLGAGPRLGGILLACGTARKTEGENR